MPNPCLGIISLRRGALIMGMLSVGRAVIMIISVAGLLGIYFNSKESFVAWLKEFNVTLQVLDLPPNTVIGVGAYMILVFTLEVPLYLSITSFAASKGNRMKSNQWVTKCILLQIGAELVLHVAGMLLSEDRIIVAVFLGMVLTYDFYLYWVVKAYAKEEIKKPNSLLEEF